MDYKKLFMQDGDMPESDMPPTQPMEDDGMEAPPAPDDGTMGN